MGVRYSSSESAALIEAMSGNIQIAKQITEKLTSGSDYLIAEIEAGKLQGAANEAGKNLFGNLIVPSIKKLQEAIDDIQIELNSYKNADAVVSQYGNMDLDDLPLQELLELVQNNPGLLRRPIMIDDKRLQVGFNEDEIRRFLPRDVRQLELRQAQLMAGL